jgi:hypothetical protein
MEHFLTSLAGVLFLLIAFRGPITRALRGAPRAEARPSRDELTEIIELERQRLKEAPRDGNDP